MTQKCAYTFVLALLPMLFTVNLAAQVKAEQSVSLSQSSQSPKYVKILDPEKSAALCSGLLGDNIFSDGDFGSGTENTIPYDPNLAPGYIYETAPPPDDGYYCIANSTEPWGSFADIVWIATEDNSDDPNGYMMVVNASYEPGVFYTKTINGLCENTLYEFSADIINLIKPQIPNYILPDVSFLIDGFVAYSTGNVPQDSSWTTYGFTFITLPGVTSLDLSIRNNAPGGFGNDLALDNISLRPCGPDATVNIVMTNEICSNEEYVFEAVVDIENGQFDEYFYQWEVSEDDGQTWNLIPTGTSAIYTEQNPVDGFQYRFNYSHTQMNLYQTSCKLTSEPVTLNVIPVSETLIPNIVICQGESYSITNVPYSENGIFVETLVAANGCDSILTLDLTVHPNYLEEFTQTICEGEAFDFGSFSYNESGSYSETFQTINGCDSTIELSLTVLSSFTTEINQAICADASFTVGNNVYSEAGFYSDTLITASGCDSIVNLNLQIDDLYVTNLEEELCEGSVYELGNNSYFASGNYSQLFTATNGCDSLVNLDLSILSNFEITIQESICDGDSIILANQVFNTTGIHDILLTAVDGCDSLIHLELTVNPIYEMESQETLCAGEFGSIGGTAYFETGIYSETFQSQAGCDSIVTLDLTVLPLLETTLDLDLCEGESYSIGNVSYGITGMFSHVLVAENGCDSTVYINMTVSPNFNATIDTTICEGASIIIDETIFHSSGTYLIEMQTVDGCDSLINLELIVNPIYTIESQETVCAGEFGSIGGTAFFETGIYSETFLSQAGCDSTITLDLTVLPLIETTLDIDLCEGEFYSIGNVDYGITGTFSHVLVAENGCDSTVFINMTISPNFSATIDTTICEGASILINETTFDTSGTYLIELQTVDGCDSIIALNLLVNEVYEQFIVQQICPGESFSISGNSYSETGNYTEQLLSTQGCDSIVHLDLLVTAQSITNLELSLCDGESVEVGNNEYFDTGTYADSLFSYSGCDSIVLLNLTINPVYNILLDEVICEGESIQVGDQFYSTSGFYSNTLNSINNCDSIVELNLTVLQPSYFSQEINICDGENFNGITSDSLHVEQLIAANGCDSTATTQIILSVIPLAEIAGESTICKDETSILDAGNYNAYLWSNDLTSASIEANETGIYYVTVSNENGCTDVAQFELEVIEMAATVDFEHPDCQGNNNGNIFISEPSGGQAPYLYQINEGSFQSSSQFYNLAANGYEVIVQDSYGCEFADSIYLEDSSDFEVDLGEDMVIPWGETAILDARVNGNYTELIWSPTEVLSCTDCLDPEVTTEQFITVYLKAISTIGCEAEDAINIWVEKERPVYIPNIFSPNGDGQNDIFYIMGNDKVKRIKQFMVFDRWGEQLHAQFDFPPNDPSFGWNGTLRNKELNSKVFIYIAEVEYIDGVIEMFKGDVTLMR